MIWIKREHLLGDTEYVCSECGYKADKPYEVCPNCNDEAEGVKDDPAWVEEVIFMDFLD
ncbi:MAG: DNA repair protein RadA [Clostridia bacterium]|nr:DNA repair protein RadA [Clostridia bacterium]